MGRGNADNAGIPVLAQRLKQARLEAGLKQREAADVLGVSPNTIWRYENDRLTPSNAALLGLSHIYAKPVAWFRGVADAAGLGPASITPDEQRVLDSYRSVPKDRRALLRSVIEAVADYEAGRGKPETGG